MITDLAPADVLLQRVGACIVTIDLDRPATSVPVALYWYRLLPRAGLDAGAKRWDPSDASDWAASTRIFASKTH